MSVNQDNIIVRVNSAWDRFACDNDGAHLANDAVLDLNLLDSIAGKTSKNSMEGLVNLDQTVHVQHARRRFQA